MFKSSGWASSRGLPLDLLIMNSIPARCSWTKYFRLAQLQKVTIHHFNFLAVKILILRVQYVGKKLVLAQWAHISCIQWAEIKCHFIWSEEALGDLSVQENIVQLSGTMRTLRGFVSKLLILVVEMMHLNVNNSEMLNVKEMHKKCFFNGNSRVQVCFKFVGYLWNKILRTWLNVATYMYIRRR